MQKYVEVKGGRFCVPASVLLAQLVPGSEEDPREWGQRIKAELGMIFEEDYDSPGKPENWQPHFTAGAAEKIRRYVSSCASAVQRIFTFESTDIRTIKRDGEPWFVAADIATVLEIGRTDDATRRLDGDEKGTATIRTPGGNQQLTIINESGLYSLIMTSRKPEAKRFKKWVTSEVLPSIRKTGSYGTADPMKALSDPATMRSLLLTYSEKVLELQPKAEALDRLSGADGSLCLTDAAKTLQTPPHKFNQFLQASGWIYRRPGKGSFIAYQTKIQAGYLIHKVTTIPLTGGEERISEQVRVTPKGMARLATMMGPKG